jgi:hypothetical protein
MQSLLDVARDRQKSLDEIADRAGARAARAFRELDPANLDARWAVVASAAVASVSAAQVSAARQSTGYTNRVARLERAETLPAILNPEAFSGVTREGRELAPELYGAVTTTKKLVGGGAGIASAFRAGAAMMSLIAANAVRDMGRSADSTIAVGKGFLYSVRVVNAGACSRCAILAGVKGYRTDFERHPGCRCTSMPLRDEDDTPNGFFRSAEDYFESLSPAERERVFTKSGAWAIENGASPTSVVNARRGALRSSKRADGSYSLASLRPTVIGRKADGSPLTVYATPEGTTARSSWGRAQGLNRGIAAGDRYRRTSTLRLMPQQIMQMGGTPERTRELLARYGYLQ